MIKYIYKLSIRLISSLARPGTGLECQGFVDNEKLLNKQQHNLIYLPT